MCYKWKKIDINFDIVSNPWKLMKKSWKYIRILTDYSTKKQLKELFLFKKGLQIYMIEWYVRQKDEKKSLLNSGKNGFQIGWFFRIVAIAIIVEWNQVIFISDLVVANIRSHQTPGSFCEETDHFICSVFVIEKLRTNDFCPELLKINCICIFFWSKINY